MNIYSYSLFRRWTIWFLPAFYMFYQYGIQVLPSIKIPYIESHYFIGNFRVALLSTFYLLPYVLLQLPAGTLIDRVDVRKVLTSSISLFGDWHVYYMVVKPKRYLSFICIRSLSRIRLIMISLLINTSRLVIRPPTLDDINHWYFLHSDPDVMQYMGGIHPKKVIQEWLKSDILHFKKHGFSMGSVYEKNSNEFIGCGGLVYLDHDDTQPNIEIGYVLHKKYWGQGYGTEIIHALMNWGFTHLEVNKLVAVTRRQNARSRRLLERCGMQFTKITAFRGEEFLQYTIHRAWYNKS